MIEINDPKIKAVLFDLDGTLLPMEQDDFIKDYFGRLAKNAAEHGYDPDRFIEVIWKGTKAMMKNNGEKSNEEVFWNVFTSEYGEEKRSDQYILDEFYEKEFDKVKEVCSPNPEMPKTVYALKEAGYRIVLATNPVFPSVATEARIRWAGLKPGDFEFYTTYENSHYCKPSEKYYTEIINKLGLTPEECMMVGNDVDEDILPARSLGMAFHLVTDCLINRSGQDIAKLLSK